MSENAKNKSQSKGVKKTPARKGKLTTQDYKNAGKEVAKDFVVGALGGGFIGALTGRLSLLSGAVVTYIGHLKKNRLVQAAGLGMMTAGGLITSQKAQESVNGTNEGIVEKTKSQFKTMQQNLSEQLFLDKLPFGKKTNEAVNGAGETKYLAYPSGEERSHLDMSRLDNIQNAVNRNADRQSGKGSGETPEHLEDGRIY